MFKRVFLFLAVNMLVMVTISFTLSILGVGNYLDAQYGIQYEQLAIFCLVWGMGGSLISLALSRVMAKSMMGVQVIDPNTHDPHLRELVTTVHRLSRNAGLTTMPEVGIYDAPELNAFATGPTKSRSLVAVSTGLMGNMNRQEVEGVLAHEVAHIANGDMVTLTLIQGVVNAFAMFLARVLAFGIGQAMRSKDDDGESAAPSMLQYILVPIFEIFFTILGSMVTAWFSRYREFRADAGGAKLAGRMQMVSALQALQRFYENPRVEGLPDAAPASMQAFQIASRKKKSFVSLFSTHPPLEDRIATLMKANRLA